MRAARSLCAGRAWTSSSAPSPADAAGLAPIVCRRQQCGAALRRGCCRASALWLNGRCPMGAVAVAIGLAMRMWGMSQWIMWEVSALFESDRHGLGRHVDDRSRTRSDKKGAKAYAGRRGEIRFENVRFHYGKKKGVIEDLTLDDQAGREGRSGRPFRRRQVDAGQPAAALLRPGSGPITIDGQDIAHVTQESLRAADRHGDAGHLAAAPLGARQHRLRPPDATDERS
jgi:ABC-type multidrug transport system fused ATPase/permease subunit